MSSRSDPGPQHRGAVVFDLDGVIFRGDTFARLVLHQLRTRPGRALPMVGALTTTARSLSGARTRGAGLERLARTAVSHLSLPEYRALAATFGHRLAEVRGAVPGAVAEIELHRRAGAQVVVATASEVTLARAYLDGVGLGDVGLVGSVLNDPREGFALHARGVRKLETLEQAGVVPPFAAVYTDSMSDLPLLEQTGRPVLVNASARTVAAATAALGVRPDQRVW